MLLKRAVDTNDDVWGKRCDHKSLSMLEKVYLYEIQNCVWLKESDIAAQAENESQEILNCMKQ